MDAEKKTIIKESITRKETKLKTRGALISQGFGSEGFDALYAEVLAELGAQEPKEQMPTSLLTTGEAPLSNRFDKKRATQRLHYIFTLVLFLGVCALLLWFGIKAIYPLITKDAISQEVNNWGERMEESTGLNPLNSTDSLLQAKVESTAASANIYVGRMDFFEGVCSDISVVPPVNCSESATGFAIFTRLSNGTFYCVDRTGFRDILPQVPAEKGVCTAR
jgi:hypothetical protein